MKGCYIIVLVVERYENKTQGYALLAQLVEQRTLNPRVQGSSLFLFNELILFAKSIILFVER